MRIRSLCLIALFLVLGVALPATASAQDAQATPEAKTAAVAKNVKRVLSDYKNDGKIDPCRHSAKDLRDTLKAIEANTEQYAPDFPAAVEAALEARASGDCREPEATPTPAPTATPAPDPAPAPAAPAAPAAPSAPSAPVVPADPEPPVTPAVPEVPEADPAPTPAPTQEVVPEPPAPDGAGIASGTPTPPAPDPNIALERAATQRDSSLGPAPWIVLGGLLGAALLAALMVLFLKRFGWGEERLAPVVHAVGEAGYRTGGTWQSFTDWARRGR